MTKKRYRVLALVHLEVEAFHRGEAGIIAVAATGWPTGSGYKHEKRPTFSGVLNGEPISAEVVYAEVAMSRELEPGEYKSND